MNELKEQIRIGYVGLGRRGMSVLEQNLVHMRDVEIAYLCDTYPPAMEKARELLLANGRPEPRLVTDYREILVDEGVDAVFLMTGWDGRSEMAEAALLAGKHAAVEVGCAFSLLECGRLLAAHKKTGAHLMMLENTCYMRRELMVLNVARQGLFGEIVHCDGGYHHDLRACDLFKEVGGPNPHYRIGSYIERNCEQYPTHELGPIAKLLGIGHGNRFLTLSSFASKSRGLREGAAHLLGEDSPYASMDYAQGDVITTLITCENGETVHLCLDTTLPRPYYSRNYTVRGTLGGFMEERRVLFFEGMGENLEDNEEKCFETYDHPLFRQYLASGIEGGHSGADYLTCRAFLEAVKAGTPPPIDTYDTLTWMAVAPLSEASIKAGGAPVPFPDYSEGAWRKRAPFVGKYSLDLVCNLPEQPIAP